MAQKRRKRKRKGKGSRSSASSTQTGGGLLQGIHAGLRRAAGTDRDEKSAPSKVGNIITTVLLIAAVAMLLYRFYG